MKTDETPAQRQARHDEHQAMLQEHKERKEIARERHHPKVGRPWHRIKVIPTQLV